MSSLAYYRFLRAVRPEALFLSLWNAILVPSIFSLGNLYYSCLVFLIDVFDTISYYMSYYIFTTYKLVDLI